MNAIFPFLRNPVSSMVHADGAVPLDGWQHQAAHGRQHSLI
jgi:hypothetical protein